MVRLFVYGTLLSPIENVLEMIFPAGGDSQPASVKGFLFNVGTYPALVLNSSGDEITGELYTFPESFSFKELDKYEEYHPHDPEQSEYLRIQTEVTLEDNSRCNTWIYVYNKSTDNLEKISSGNYLEFLESAP